VVLISTFEKSGGGAAAGAVCAHAGPDNTIAVATTAVLTLFIPAPSRDFLMS
jgi:hypothetical protein